MQPFMLEGKTVLITGASSGIGRGIAIACAKAGAKCILVARDVTRLNETLSLCEGEGHTIEALDVTDYEALTALVDCMPVLDGLVQSAGIGDNQTLLKFLKPEFIDKLLNVNVKAPILLLATLEKKKKLAKGASVVMISSIADFHATPAHSLYGATKGAITSFVKGAALDLAGKKIRVNSIAPGMVNTPLIDFSSLTEEQRKANEARYPLKRYGEPEDIAGMALYLLSDVSTWVTGQQFVLDGGFTIGG
jgi:NAD(P)-dependent dehydrogenase (short-subunit alcohol dehydrogenase family)